VLNHSKAKGDFKFHEEIGNLSTSLKDQFEEAFAEKAGGRSLGHLIPYAVAAYKLVQKDVDKALQEAQEGNKRKCQMPFISFPWVLHEVLGQIAKMADESENLPAFWKTRVEPSDAAKQSSTSCNGSLPPHGTSSQSLPFEVLTPHTVAGLGNAVSATERKPNADPHGSEASMSHRSTPITIDSASGSSSSIDVPRTHPLTEGTARLKDFGTGDISSLAALDINKASAQQTSQVSGKTQGFHECATKVPSDVARRVNHQTTRLSHQPDREGGLSTSASNTLSTSLLSKYVRVSQDDGHYMSPYRRSSIKTDYSSGSSGQGGTGKTPLHSPLSKEQRSPGVAESQLLRPSRNASEEGFSKTPTVVTQPQNPVKPSSTIAPIQQVDSDDEDAVVYGDPALIED